MAKINKLIEKSLITFAACVVVISSGSQYTYADGHLKTILNTKHSPYAFSVCYSPTGKFVASGGSDNTIKIWDSHHGKIVRILSGHTKGVIAVRFTPDEKHLVSLSHPPNAEIQIWDIAAAKQIKTISRGWYVSLDVSSNGNMVSACGDSRFFVWSLKTGKIIHESSDDTKYNRISFSPDGTLLAAAGMTRIDVYRISDWKITKSLLSNSEQTNSIKFSNDGKLLAWGGKDGIVRISKTDQDEMIKSLDGHTKQIVAICFSYDNRTIYSAAKDGRINIWDLMKEKLINTINGLGPFILSIDVSVSDHNLVSGSNDINIWNGQNGRHIKKLGETSNAWVNAIAISPKNNRLFWGGLSHSQDKYGEIRLLDIGAAKDIGALTSHKSSVHSIALGQKYLVSGSADKSLALWDIKEMKLLRSFKAHEVAVDFVNIFLGDRYIISAGCEVYNDEYGTKNYGLCGSSSIKLWESANGNLIAVIDNYDGPVQSLVLSSMGSYYAATNGKMVKVWNATTGNLVFHHAPDRRLTSIAFSPDERYLAFSNTSDEIAIWDLKSSVPAEAFLVNQRLYFNPFNEVKTIHIDSLIYSKDGRYLISGDGGGYIGLWDIKEKKLLWKQKIHNQEIRALCLSGDGNSIISAGWDGIRITDINSAKVLCEFFSLHESLITLTPEGFFSGTGDFNKYVHFVKGLEVYDFNQFYDAFYRPDLVEKKLKGEDISIYTRGLTIENALKNPPPKVTFISPKDGEISAVGTARAKIQIQDLGGGIGDIRVYHNGKLIDSLGVYRLAKSEPIDDHVAFAKTDVDTPYKIGQRGANVRRIMDLEKSKDVKIIDFTPQTGTIERTYTIPLIKGENTISVSAFNGTNTVMSAIESVKVNANIQGRKPQLHALVVGIDHFKDSSWNLALAGKDADDFSRLLQKAADPLYEKVHIQTLRDTNKISVLEAVDTIRTQAKPEDTFVFFAATHGRAEDDLYYLYTADFNGNLRDPKSYLSSIEMMEVAKKIPALKQVFLLDTCQSGGVAAIVTGLYDARISVLAKALGMHIFAGAKSYQDAQDRYKENGLFTHFVLQGMEGEADKDKDGTVTVLEMTPYLSRTVKEASKGTQEPFIRNFGDDLPIGRVMHGSQ